MQVKRHSDDEKHIQCVITDIYTHINSTEIILNLTAVRLTRSERETAGDRFTLTSSNHSSSYYKNIWFIFNIYKHFQ